MGRCGWSKKIALLCALLVASCGGTGGGPSDSGKQFVFQARGRLNLVLVSSTGSQEVMPVSEDNPTVLTLQATLLDPQDNPFRDTRITFEAEFADATFIPQDRNPATCSPVTCSNRGAVLTDEFGQARITLIAGLTTGRMRIIAEAPPALNIAMGISVDITNQGFITRGVLGIIPAGVIFVNPLVRPGENGPMTVFNAVGGTPPYRWDNSNKNLGTITPKGLEIPKKINEKAEYTLTGPIPTDQSQVLQDTVTLLDSEAGQATATVTVVFAECTLNISANTIDIGGAEGGEQAQIKITNGVPFLTGNPYTVTQTFPEAGSITFDPKDPNIVIFTVAPSPIGVDPDTLLIRDSRGCVATVAVTITPAIPTIVLTANPASISGTSGGTSAITANVFNSKNQPIANVTVLFTTTKGTLAPITALTDSKGQAPPTTLTIPPGTAAGTATVTGSARGGSGTVTVTIAP